RSAGKWYACQRTRRGGAEQYRHLARRTDGKDTGLRKIQGSVLAAAGTQGKHRHRFVGPLRAKEYGLRIRLESRRGNIAAPIGQPLESRLRRGQNLRSHISSSCQRDDDDRRRD